MSKTYKIISKEPAPERVVNVFSISDLIQFSDGLSNDALEEWFTEYRYDAEISQGEVFHNKSKFKEVEFPDGTTKINEIPVDGNGFDEEELELVKKMQDLDILIKGELEWTGGAWNTFSIELDDSEEFDLKKIKAEGDCGLIINYTYDGNDFTNDEDWLLSDGYSNIEVSIFYDGSLHKIELDELQNELEEKGIDTKNIDSDALSNCLIEKIKKQEILSENESQDVPVFDKTQIDEVLSKFPEDMSLAAKELGLEYDSLKEIVFADNSYPALKDKWTPELKEPSDISDFENVNKIKSIVTKCLEKGESFPSWPDILAENGCDVEPYSMMTAIIKIKLDNGAFYVALKYKVKDKADFIVGKFAGWSDN